MDGQGKIVTTGQSADANVFDVGVRLKEARLTAGLSQRELASRANVPHGLISLIEKNKCSPSVSSLRKITGGLPMTLGEFFKEDDKPNDQFFFSRDQMRNLTPGIAWARRKGQGRIDFWQIGDAKKANLQLIFERYEPGADTGETLWQHESHEGGMILRGELEITVGNRVSVLKVGEGFIFDSRLPHRYRNIGAEVCEIILACTPPYL